MKRFVLAFLVSILATGAEAHAQNFLRTAVCTAENSETTTIAAIAAKPEAWFGRCAQVDGLYTGERVYADLDAIYGLDRNFVGGFIDGQPPMPGAWRGRFVGRVFDCAEAWDTLLNDQLRAPGISLNGRPLGCKEGRGPFLMFMTGSELTPSGLKRRLPGAKGGDLEVAHGWAPEMAMDVLAEQFMFALREKSVANLTRIVGNAYVADRLMNDEGSIWKRMAAEAPANHTLFRDTRVTGDDVAGEACWSSLAGIAMRWPIASRDADNQLKRPYACLRIEGAARDGKWNLRIDPSMDVDGLEEP